jgi:hypothetical protein
MLLEFLGLMYSKGTARILSIQFISRNSIFRIRCSSLIPTIVSPHLFIKLFLTKVPKESIEKALVKSAYDAVCKNLRRWYKENLETFPIRTYFLCVQRIT